MLTCAQCEHYKHQPNDPDLRSRVCYGGPPQVLNMPVQTPRGPGITQVLTRPNPAPTEPACGAFKFKLAFTTIENEQAPSDPVKAL